MRHRVYGRHLGRDKNQRTALFRGLVRSLILHESITTTSPKAKAIKGFVDHLISKGQQGTEGSKQVVLSNIPQKEVREKLLGQIVPRYKNRISGFTTTTRLGQRAGDGAMLVRMSLIDGDIKEKKDAKKEESEVKESEEVVEEKKVVKKAKTKKEEKGK